MTSQFDTLYSTPEMAALFSAESQVRHLLRFEAALARAEARAGLVPAAAAEAIAAACRNVQLDVAELFREAALAGTPVIPLVRMLGATLGDGTRGYLHQGATSQDVLDTALVLQMRSGLELLEQNLLETCAACALLAGRYRNTLMAGRTLLQQALPITFGLKAARWLALCCRQVEALRAVRSNALALQFGGAAGTLAALGDRGVQVAAFLAEELALPLPGLPWHAERDRIAQVASALGVLAGAMLKIAGDVILLAQSEVAEVAEQTAPGKGGSSAMPHKHNPVDAIFAVASARLALGYVPTILNSMAQEHERAAGSWQTEWQAIPALFCAAGGAVARVARVAGGLQVNEQRMRSNLDIGGGLAMSEALMVALAAHTGRQQAQQLVQNVSQLVGTGTTLLESALANQEIYALLGEQGIHQAL
ncbi:MAG TPA: 3-carboxy-cis,cis-muconate cycloisomerase, partial [Roseiflexaceae bacterium]|nr:3-carboxy-cis,cis-muconate cycloisomerase [Roseiflexaceae bacterium]